MKKIMIIILLLSISLIAKNNDSIFKKINNDDSIKNIIKNEILRNINNKNDYKFILKKSIKGLSGVLYKHYSYKFKNLLVYPETIVISIKDDTPFLVTGNFIALKMKSIASKYSEMEAFNHFKKSVQTIKFYSDIAKAILIKNNKSYIVYKALIEYTSKNEYHLGEIYIDANTLSKLDFYSSIYEVLNRRVYNFHNRCLKTDAVYYDLPEVCSHYTSATCTGTLLFSEGEPNNDDLDALYAYNNTGITYWFYKNMFNRDSFDNDGKTLVSTVHIQYYDNAYGCHGYNASFMGAPFYQMVYGDGNPNTQLDDYARALDVVAHELTHAVTDRTSNLIYKDEQGALNEAISDIFGSTTEAWSDSGGTESGNPLNFVANDNTWKIGEKIGRPMRYMNTPSLASQSQPNHYDDLQYIGTPQDNGGVHINSGIINLAYYLLVEGGKHPTRVQNNLQAVNGIGLEKAIKIYYEAQIGLFTPHTNFSDARKLLSQAAENLYGNCSYESEQVNRAFDIVGVPGLRKDECVKTCEDLDCSSIENSICIGNENNHFCKCNDGFHWNENHSVCEENDICYDITCEMNNSHCEEFQGKPNCICDVGYYPNGQSCLEKEKDPCENITCSEHGRCFTVGGTKKTECLCDAGYENGEGLSCVKYTNPCKDINCSNHGNCIVKNNEALCGCFDGYHVKNLECIKNEVDLCENINCNNHGTCVSSNNKANCLCESGYTLDKSLRCIKKDSEIKEINKVSKNMSSCNYGNSDVNSFFIFILFSILFFMNLKKKFLTK